MEAVDGWFDYVAFNDSDVSTPIDPDTPCSSSSMSQLPPDTAVTISEAPTVKKIVLIRVIDYQSHAQFLHYQKE